MSLDHGEENRQVIPRWRNFATTIKIGELDSVAQTIRAPIEIQEGLWTNKLQEWRDNPASIFASDVLGCAIALGRSSEALEAAEYLIKSGTLAADSAREVAKRTIVAVAASTEPEFHLKHFRHEDLFPEIHHLRKLLRQEPRDAFGWCDLALLHETLGHANQAEWAMNVALSLAPENRFLLRSAVRLFLHHDDLDRAHHVVSTSQAGLHDPWVLAAEIAVVDARGQVSRNIKRAKKMLVAGKSSPRHLSELWSAIATVELRSGNIKHARRNFRESLVEPTENALAQAKWAARRIGHIDFGAELIEKTPLSHEVKAWDYFVKSEWQMALKESWRWFRDQPFSSLPPIHGSFIATTALEEHEEAARMARCGLVANPTDFLLRNNLVVALARAGRIEEAESEAARIRGSQLGIKERITWLATSGLIGIRNGAIVRGREYYLEAMKEAAAAREERLRIMAFLNLALESVSANLEQAERDRKESLHEAKQIRDPVIGVLVERLKGREDKRGQRHGMLHGSAGPRSSGRNSRPH